MADQAVNIVVFMADHQRWDTIAPLSRAKKWRLWAPPAPGTLMLWLATLPYLPKPIARPRTVARRELLFILDSILQSMVFGIMLTSEILSVED